MKTVLVSCVGKKTADATMASDLYRSTWFLLAKEYCLSHGYQWFILSARYGLLNINTIIEPYDLTLKECNQRYQRVWSQRVFFDIKEKIPINTTLVIFAGVQYRRFLYPSLCRYGYNIEIPMRGLGIGKQLQWLKANI